MSNQNTLLRGVETRNYRDVFGMIARPAVPLLIGTPSHGHYSRLVPVEVPRTQPIIHVNLDTLFDAHLGPLPTGAFAAKSAHKGTSNTSESSKIN